jgi:UDP-N-acetylglucosamine--N-acetylmuramyl-(pentapeptide) pyrophosphoryl-undecaprenol N-acetylglucosamine transferase
MYVGAKKGVEKAAVLKFMDGLEFRNFEYKSVASGKLRRYFSVQNFFDMFKVVVGFFQAVRLVQKFDPHVVFSKGGFMTVPVVLGTGFVNLFRKKDRRVRVIVHESDVSPGLANVIGARFAGKIFVSFEESKKAFKKYGDKVELVGNPIRKAVLKGSSERGMKLCGFNRFRDVLLVMGGSQGATQINELVWENLNELLKKWQVVHITGKGNLKFGLKKDGYKQFEILYKELPDVYAACDLVVTRGGANSLTEIASLEKKALIIPLGLDTSRGDQIVNARICAEEYGWQVLQGEVSGEQFLRGVEIASGEEFKGEEVLHKKAAGKIVEIVLQV